MRVKPSLCLTLLLSVSAPEITLAAQTAVPAGAAANPAPAREMTAVDLLSLQRASDPHLSPDGRIVLYRVSTSDWKKKPRHPFAVARQQRRQSAAADG